MANAIPNLKLLFILSLPQDASLLGDVSWLGVKGVEPPSPATVANAYARVISGPLGVGITPLAPSLVCP